MSYPWDFEPKIDAEDVLDYVLENKSWFLEKLNEENDGTYKIAMTKMANYFNKHCFDEWDFLRKVRDGTSNLSKDEIIQRCSNVYETLEELRNYFNQYATED